MHVGYFANVVPMGLHKSGHPNVCITLHKNVHPRQDGNPVNTQTCKLSMSDILASSIHPYINVCMCGHSVCTCTHPCMHTRIAHNIRPPTIMCVHPSIHAYTHRSNDAWRHLSKCQHVHWPLVCDIGPAGAAKRLTIQER